MASQVLSGSSNPSYTNNTGQNVRVVINYMNSSSYPTASSVSLSWGGVTVSSPANVIAIGRNIASGSSGTQNSDTSGTVGLPTELMLSASETFSAVCGAYNIVIIKEDGT
jgi:hypothetical protein